MQDNHNQVALNNQQKMQYHKLQTFNSEEQGNKTHLRPSIIQKYNIFIQCYNRQCNRINQKTLCLMPQSKSFDFFYKVFALNSKRIMFLLLLLFLPLINLFLLVFLFRIMSIYLNCLKIHKNNKKRIQHPFKNMRFDAQKCERLKKNHHFFILNFKNLNKFNFKENKQLTESQNKIGEKSQWMIYNQEFKQYYTGLETWKKRLYVILAASITEIIVSNVFFIVFLFL